VSAGFGIARAVSHPFRHWYEKHYRPRHRFPLSVFLFDLSLLGVIIALIVVIISLKVMPPEPPTLRLSMITSPVIALQPMALAARITPADQQSHAAVTVSWGIPSGWEVISSDPPLRADGTAYLGSIPADGDRISRIVVRPISHVGTDETVGIVITQQAHGMTQTYYGSRTLSVRSSALTADIPSAFQTDAIVPSGAIVPILVSNASDLLIPSVELRPSDSSTVAFARIAIGDLPAYTSRIVYVPMGNLSAPPHLAWSVFAASREIVQQTFSPRVEAWTDPIIERAPVLSATATSTSLRVRFVGGGDLLVIPPASTSTILSIPVITNDESISIPLVIQSTQTADDRWLISPVRHGSEGMRTLGAGQLASSVSSFPFSETVLYTSPSGDQLGIGPNPPRANEETRYWVFWHVGPIQHPLRDLSITAAVGDRVKLTGNVATPDGGVSSISGSTIRWTLPAIGTDAGSAEATFGFEIAVLPKKTDIATSIELVGPAQAAARSTLSNETLSSDFSSQYSQKIEAEGQVPIQVK
jgi:hypothetical protein